jgi:hypothetical protein
MKTPPLKVLPGTAAPEKAINGAVLVEFCCASPGLVVAVTLLNDGGAKDVPATVWVVKAC